VSDAAERIEAARLVFVASRGTPREPAAREALRAAIRASTLPAQAAAIISATAPPAASEPEIRTLGEVIPARAVLAILRSSVQTTLTTALGFRGLALDPQTLAELCDELARNAANVLCITEIK
jgi:hypothetical protein